MEKKFELTDEKFVKGEIILYRIIAVRDFSDVSAGEFGGWVEEESNLSHEGDCWIYDEGKVFTGAKVYGNAKVRNNALVFANTLVFQNAEVIENARVYKKCRIFGNAKLFGSARVSNWSAVFGNANVSDDFMCGSIKFANYE